MCHSRRSSAKSVPVGTNMPRAASLACVLILVAHCVPGGAFGHHDRAHSTHSHSGPHSGGAARLAHLDAATGDLVPDLDGLTRLAALEQVRLGLLKLAG